MAEVVNEPVVTTPREAKGLSIAGMVLGICSIVLAVWLGFILGVLAIIFSAIGLKRKKPNGIALAGLITGIIGTIISLIVGIFFIIVFVYAGVTQRANETSLNASASTVQKEAELFDSNYGAYPSFDEMQNALNQKGYGITIDKQGVGSGGDIVYIPCKGYGAIIWYWSETDSDYKSLYAGSTDDCEWN